MKSKLKPEIRFLGFTGEWEQRRLGEILKINSGRDYKHLQTGNIPVYGTGGFMLSVNDKLSEEDAIGIGRKGTIDKPQLLKAPFWTVDTLFYMTAKERNDLQFFYSLAKKINWKKYDESTGVPSLSKSSIDNISINIPKHEEQSQIGNFFKQLDKTIALHQQELATLKQAKQGFLQTMFPKEGESLPDIRFPGFSGDWMKKELKEISIMITKGTTPSDKSWEGTIKYIKTDSINALNGNIENASRISNIEHEGNLKRSKLMVNDILFSIVGTLGRVGIVKEKDLPANTNQQICIIRLGEGDINFILNSLKTPSIKKFIKSDATIGAQPSISLWQMEALKISYPQIEEQQKIGNFFKQLDDIISLQQRELDTLKETKKAFLQKMFV